MPDVIHRWEMSQRLQCLVSKHGGILAVGRTASWHSPAEWAKQFRIDLERSGLSGRTRSAIVFSTHRAVTEWQYDASTERWYRPLAQANFYSDLFQLGGELLGFDRWCNAIAQGKISSSELMDIPNFGSKSLEDLLEAICRMLFSDLPNVET